MKFRYYITDMFDGAIKGTNDTDTAYEYSLCEDYFVVDADTGVWILGDMGTVEVKDIGGC